MPTRTFSTMTPILLSRIAQDLLDSERRLSDDERPTWRRALLIAQTHGQEISKEEDRIDADAHLTPAGKREALAKIAQAKVAGLNAITTLRSETQAEAVRRRAHLFEIPKYEGTNDMVDRLDQREIRDAMKGKPQSEIIQAFTDAVKDGRTLAQRALLTGPMGPLLQQDIAQRVLAEHLETTRPAEYRKLESVENLKEHLMSLEQHTTMWLADLGAHTADKK